MLFDYYLKKTTIAFILIFYLITCSCYAISNLNIDSLELKKSSGFFRVGFENQIHMPNQIPNMGLLSLNYFADLSPSIYAGFGGYGAATGTQGGLFTVGFGAGVHHELFSHIWGDGSIFIGGGGGKSSLTGGGLMIQPQIGLAYDLSFGKLGIYFSNLQFPNGEINSKQFGVNIDLPVDVYYLNPHDELAGSSFIDLDSLNIPIDQYLFFQKNNFSLLTQAYYQKSGTLNTLDQVQDHTIGLIGAEFDHYFSNSVFWWLKTSGAFTGIPNGYMDVISGLGYSLNLGDSDFSLVPEMGLGAGGGGLVETGGGFLVNPLLGIEWNLLPGYSVRVSSGYIWAPNGNFSVTPLTTELIYHFDIASLQKKSADIAELAELNDSYIIEGWRFQFLQQTYFNPQRSYSNLQSSIQLFGVQIDQIMSSWFFMSYQATGAYVGYHSGGYATGMIGPGLQTKTFFNNHLQLFTNLLIGAGGGGGLALSGGAIIEPLVGIRYKLTPTIDIQASAGELKALKDNLNTPVLNIGISARFDTLVS